MKRLWSLLGLLLAAGVLRLPAQEPKAEAAEVPAEFVVAFSPKELTLDPLHIYTTMESELSTAIYEGLVTYHPFTLEPIPGAAYDWKLSLDKTTYTFFLRENARFSNGDPLRAADFRDSWLRILDPEAGAEYSFLFDVIKGARDYRLGRSREVPGIRVQGDHELVVELEKPASHFLKLLCHTTFVPLHPSYLQRKGWDADPTLIGNGPFYLYERSPGEIQLKRNQLYWDSSRVELGGVRVRFMEDQQEVSRGFNKGEIHWSTNWDTELLLDRTKIVFNPLFATSYFFFVCTQPPWNDARVRRALALLVPWDKVRSEDTLLPTSRLIPPIPVYPEVKGIQKPDRNEALRLLEEAGYPGGRGLPPVIFKLPDDEESTRVAAIMAEAWKAELGVEVRAISLPYNRYLVEVKKGDFTLGAAIWIGDYADPLTFLQMWTADSNLNDAHFVDSEFEALIDGSFSLEGKARYDQLGKSEELLLQRAVVLPISHTPAFNLIDLDRVEGWFPNVLNIHPFKYIRFRTLRVPEGVASR
jgi:oligopeptide transport system substrate-binding protein